MAGNLSFSIAINLLTENFKRGANGVKAGFKAMQMQVLTFAAALGAGSLGLGNLISRLVDTARETTRVTTALKNVSGSTAQFAENQRFLLDIAKKYGLEINSLTGNFAKFTASATNAGVSMGDQKKIFESVSRANTAFALSADESNGVMLALSQMMGKGKISSEELRRQMGEKLPIALAAMAKAAGVSMGELEKLLKQGKLMSADILPRFADALDEMLPNVDTDNIETSINRLKNVFTELVTGLDIQSKYKSLVDGLNSLLQGLAENIKNVFVGVAAAIGFAITAVITKVVAGWQALAGTLEVSTAQFNAKLVTATQNRVAAEIALEKAKVAAQTAIGKEKIAADKALIKAQSQLYAAQSGEVEALKNLEAAKNRANDAQVLLNAKSTAKELVKITQQRIAAEMELEKARAAQRKAINYEDTISARKRVADAETNLAKITAKEVIAQENAKAAAAQAASVKTVGFWGGAYATLKVGAAKLVVSIKAMWSAFAPAIIVSAIIGIIGYFKNLYGEAKRIKGIFGEYKKQASDKQSSPELSQLEALRDISNDIKRGDDERKKALDEIAKRLDIIRNKNESDINYQKRINDKIKERIKLLEDSAKVDFYTQQKVAAEHELKKHKKDLGLQDISEGNMDYMMANIAKYKDTGSKEALQKGINTYAEQIRRSGGEQADDYQDKLVKMSNYWQIIVDSSKEIANAISSTLKVDGNKNSDDPDKKKTPLQKAEDEYHASLLNYRNQLDAGAITQEYLPIL